MDYVLWTMDYVPCFVDYVLWTMFRVLWTMFCVLCFVDYVLWTMFCGLWTQMGTESRGPTGGEALMFRHTPKP
jgi:hypothetical protein